MFSLNWRDLFKGAVVTVLSSVFGYIYLSLQTMSFDIDWNKLAFVALTALVGYLAKNLISDKQGDVAGISLK